MRGLGPTERRRYNRMRQKQQKAARIEEKYWNTVHPWVTSRIDIDEEDLGGYGEATKLHEENQGQDPFRTYYKYLELASDNDLERQYIKQVKNQIDTITIDNIKDTSDPESTFGEAYADTIAPNFFKEFAETYPEEAYSTLLDRLKHRYGI